MTLIGIAAGLLAVMGAVLIAVWLDGRRVHRVASDLPDRWASSGADDAVVPVTKPRSES